MSGTAILNIVAYCFESGTPVFCLVEQWFVYWISRLVTSVYS